MRARPISKAGGESSCALMPFLYVAAERGSEGARARDKRVSMEVIAAPTPRVQGTLALLRFCQRHR